MAANENIWVTLQKLAAGFPGNGEEVKEALLNYYKSIKWNSGKMKETADQFLHKIGPNERIKLLAMAIYGDIHDYIPSTEGIYRGATLSKYVLLSLPFNERMRSEDRTEETIKIFKIALSGDSNSALEEMKKVFEKGSDTTADGKFQQFQKAIKSLFSTLLFFNEPYSDQITAALIPLFYSKASVSESQNVEGEPSASQQNGEVESSASQQNDSYETIISEINKKIQEKMDEIIDKDSDLRLMLLALKSDICKLQHDGRGQCGLSGLFGKYIELFARDDLFIEELKKLFQKYDAHTSKNLPFRSTLFEKLAIDLLTEEKARIKLEGTDKKIILEKGGKIELLVSTNIKDRILGASAFPPEEQALDSKGKGEEKVLGEQPIINAARDLSDAIKEACDAFNSVKTPIDDLEQKWKKIAENLFRIIGIAKDEINKASSTNDSSWLKLFPSESAQKSQRKEVYEKIQAEAEGLLTVVNQVYLHISEVAYAQRKSNSGSSSSSAMRR